MARAFAASLHTGPGWPPPAASLLLSAVELFEGLEAPSSRGQVPLVVGEA